MARNTQLELAPNQTSLVDNKGMVSDSWNKWFDRIRFYLSNANNQTLGASGSINLDASHVSLEVTTASTTITLDAPSLANKSMTIQMTSRTAPYSAALDLTNVIGGSASSTATFDAVNEILVLISVKGGKWLVLKEFGVTLT